MQDGTLNILRVGMGITFLWVGLLILQSPESWGGLMQPWASTILGDAMQESMITTAIFDILVGLLLVIGIFTWQAALVGAIHLAVVLTVVGIDAITVRDIALLTGCLALSWNALPDRIKSKFQG